MVLVSESQYDSGNDGGGGLLTKQTEHVDSSSKRETSFTHDWRGRQTDIDGEEDLCQKSTYDNLGQVTRVDRHDTTSGGNLIARSETKYDDLGRVYQTKRHAVDVRTGTSLTDNTWYDKSGNVFFPGSRAAGVAKHVRLAVVYRLLGSTGDRTVWMAASRLSQMGHNLSSLVT